MLSADCVFIFMDIDTHIPKIDLRKMSKDLIKKFRFKPVFCADYPRSGCGTKTEGPYINPRSGVTNFCKLHCKKTLITVFLPI